MSTVKEPMREFEYYSNKITTAVQHTIGSGSVMKLTNKLRFDMNERIREIADESAKYAAIMALPTGKGGDELFLEKFAELIIEERRKMDIFDTRLRQIDGKREWVGLTDEEFHDLQIEHIDDPWATFKAIEAKLKEKNT